MSNMEDRINKLREERQAREKARIQKLREINLKKYPKMESEVSVSSQPAMTSKIPSASNIAQLKNGTVPKNVYHVNGIKNVKNNFHVNGTSKRPITAPVPKNTNFSNVKSKVSSRIVSKPSKTDVTKLDNQTDEEKSGASAPKVVKNDTKIPFPKSGVAKINDRTSTLLINRNISSLSNTTNNQDNKTKNDLNGLKSLGSDKPKTNLARKSMLALPLNKSQSLLARKSMLPNVPENMKSESVFERLYKPKYVAKKPTDEVEKLKTDPNYLKKIIKTSNSILQKRHTCFDVNKPDSKVLPRRSISAVHFKRISRSELSNCFHRSASIGKLNKGLDLNEDDTIKEDKFVSAIKSERKKVKFMTPVPANFNTPKPEELQSRLKSWLLKHGKSLDSYQHLQCFGINHLKSNLGTPKFLPFNDGDNSHFDEENKENIALDSDSDDGSYLDTMNEPEETLCAGDKIDVDNWRRASFDSESIGFNDTNNFNETTVTSADTLANVDEVLLGALNDLTSLLREGFDWQQSARWLRTIRERFPHAPRTAAYWECRAALEDSRGDLPASVQCWEEAIAKGTEHSVVESNLDQLLDKFMQLKISPKSGAPKSPNPKLLDIKNVFKSTIIRFAVQQAKLRHQTEVPVTKVFTVTPVRRSARLSRCPGRTPLQLCDTVRQAATIAPQHIFTPNDNFVNTP